jgi:flagellar biosynthesis/type III secretory pathway protein FliH
MADKFLEQADLMKIMEEINMTKLGQMLVERGIEQGVEQGIAQGVKLGIEEGMDSKLNELIKIKMQKGKSIEEIADALEEDVETIRARISKMEQEEKKLL